MYVGGNLGFSRVYLFAICVTKNWLFTRIKHVLFREISVYLMYILLHNFCTGFSLRLFMLKSKIVLSQFSQSNHRVSHDTNLSPI